MTVGETLTSGITLITESSDAGNLLTMVPGMPEGNSLRHGWNVNAIYGASCLLLRTVLQSPKQWVLFL